MLFCFKVALVLFVSKDAQLIWVDLCVCDLTDELEEVEIEGSGIASLLCAWGLVGVF